MRWARTPLLLAALVPTALIALSRWGERASAAQASLPPSEMQEDEPPADEPAEPSLGAAVVVVPDAALGDAAFIDSEMVRIPATTFTMGSSDPKSPANERPRHVATVASFSIDKTEVTVGAYRRCVETHACSRPARSSPTCTYDLGDARLPVSCVRWRDAEAYCRHVGKRLPTEAEWELAARGPKGGRYPWRGSSAGCFLASTLVGETTSRTCTKGPSHVGAHAGGASPYGVLDMAGNVEEWTSDWYVESLALGAAPASGASHVLRGGGWLSTPSAARSTARNWGSSVEAGANVGFRCARSD